MGTQGGVVCAERRPSTPPEEGWRLLQWETVASSREEALPSCFVGELLLRGSEVSVECWKLSGDVWGLFRKQRS